MKLLHEKQKAICVRFHDKRDVVMLSTIHSPTITVLNKIDRRTNMLVMKPTCVVEYCKHMGGVDLSDQINGYHTVLRKTVKWYKKLFFQLFNLCIVNSYISICVL